MNSSLYGSNVKQEIPTYVNTFHEMKEHVIAPKEHFKDTNKLWKNELNENTITKEEENVVTTTVDNNATTATIITVDNVDSLFVYLFILFGKNDKMITWLNNTYKHILGQMFATDYEKDKKKILEDVMTLSQIKSDMCDNFAIVNDRIDFTIMSTIDGIIEIIFDYLPVKKYSNQIKLV